MTRPYLGFALVLVCAVSTACAPRSVTTSAGQRPENIVGGVEIQNQTALVDTVISATSTAVWLTLASVFETLEIETPTVDPRALSIGNAGYSAGRIEGKRLSTYLQCGNNIGRANADQYEVTLQLMVQLMDAPGGGTTVRTLMDAYVRPRATRGNAIHCTSKGTLERRNVELIRDELPGA